MKKCEVQRIDSASSTLVGWSKNGEEQKVNSAGEVKTTKGRRKQQVTSIPTIDPVVFLQNMLRERGYPCDNIPTQSHIQPSPQQIADYDTNLLSAIGNSDLQKLKEYHSVGKSMSACNRFSESILHMACRRSSYEVIEFLIQCGSDFTITDDYGRNPLHDACWRAEPHFDIVTLILDLNSNLIRQSDVRGCTPLHYIREEHWVQWCSYLFNQADKYWPKCQ